MFAFDSDSKLFFLFFYCILELLFTFLFYYFSFSFQNYFLLYFFFFTYVLFLLSTRTSNPPHLSPFVRGACYLFVRWY